MLHSQDRVTAVRSLLQGLPTDVLERDPMLCYWLAWSLTRLGEFDAATRPLQVAERVWTATDDRPALGAALHLHILRDMSNQNTHQAITPTAPALLPEDRLADRAISFMMLASAHLSTGDLVGAERVYTQGRILAERVGHHWS